MASPRGTRSVPEQFAGRWQVVETDLVLLHGLDGIACGQITFWPWGDGVLRLGEVEGDLDCRVDDDRLEFSWLGTFRGEPAGGRGFAEVTASDRLEGRIYFHKADESDFVAVRSFGQAKQGA